MSELKSSVLFIGAPSDVSAGMGADLLEDLPEFLESLVPSGYPVIVVSLSLFTTQKIPQWTQQIQAKSTQSLIVLVADTSNSDAVKGLINSGLIYKILKTWDDPMLEHTIREALAFQDLMIQNQKLVEAAKGLNTDLETLKTALEERVHIRQDEIEAAKIKISQTTRRSEALHQVLVSINRAQSVGDIERFVQEALGAGFAIKAIKISLQMQEQSYSKKAKNILRLPIKIQKSSVGSVSFLFEDGAGTSEKPFLSEVSTAIGLGLQRLARFEQAESLKQEWEAAFDAIEDPVSIVTKNHEIVRFNKALTKMVGRQNITGQKCYEMLFKRDGPCKDCKLGQNFNLSEVSYSVTSRALAGEEDELYLVFYRDLAEKQKLQKNIIESAKLAELGLIGGSIAHELNNPIAGMLTFAQLIKMDLKRDDPYFEDISEIEKAIQRCRDIVENLLGFSRKSDLEAPERIDINSSVEQATRLLNIQTKTLGLKIDIEHTDGEALVLGDSAHLTQAFVNILQESIASVRRRLESDRKFDPSVNINISKKAKHIEIEISDNGWAKPFETGLGLTLAYDIISHHGGSLEFLENHRAKISFPRPVFDL